MAKVIVAGAGINGVSSAVWLQRAGHDVILVDRAGPASGTSYGNAGVLAAGSIIPITTPGLLAKIPKMLFNSNAPLFVRCAGATIQYSKRKAASLEYAPSIHECRE